MPAQGGAELQRGARQALPRHPRHQTEEGVPERAQDQVGYCDSTRNVMTSHYYHQVPHGAAVGVPEGDLAALRPRPRGGVSGGARPAVQPRPHLRAHTGNTGVLLVISNTGF